MEYTILVQYDSLNKNAVIHPFRVSGVFRVRVDLPEKEASKVEWDCQGHRATKDLKDNL